MRVLVTGASGFIGRALCKRLAVAGISVRAVSRKRPSGNDVLQSGAEWFDCPGFARNSNWSDALDGVTHVVHLAAVAHRIGKHAIGESEMREVNVIGSTRLAEEASRAGVGHFVFVSSIGAVCSESSEPVSEFTKPRPDTAYGRSKLDAEVAIRRTLEGTKTGWTILRPPLVYGPGNPGNMARLQRAVRSGVPLPIRGIRNKRSFIFIENFVDAIMLVLAKPEAGARTFHIADGEIVSTPELVCAIASATGGSARLFACPEVLLRLVARVADWFMALRGDSSRVASYSLQRLSNSLVVDASAIRRELGWVQGVSMEAGLGRTLCGTGSRKPKAQS